MWTLTPVIPTLKSLRQGLQVQGKPELHSNTLSQTTKQTKILEKLVVDK